MQRRLGALREWLGKPVNQGDWRWRSAAYVFLPWLDRLVRHPRILDAVESVIGPDILVFTSTFFIKEAHSPTFAAWHQDAMYFGIEPYEHVTAWVALSDATEEAGCMKVVFARPAAAIASRRARPQGQHQRRRPGDRRGIRPERRRDDGIAGR